MKIPFLPVLLPFALLAAPVVAVEIEDEDLEELHHIGEELREELEILQAEREEIGSILEELKGELEEAEESGHRRELEREIQSLRIETETFRRVIPMLQRVLTAQASALKAAEGEDEDVFWQAFDQFHRTNEGYGLRQEIVYLEQERAISRADLKDAKKFGEKGEAPWIMLELQMVEHNLAAQHKLLHKWEELEVLWKQDPNADTDEQEEAFWVAMDVNELERQKREIHHSMEILKLEARELEMQQARLKKRHMELQDRVAEHGKIEAIFGQLQKARAEGDEFKAEELEEAYHAQREAYHIKLEIRHLSEELEFLRREGEEEETREIAGHLEELKEELEHLR